MNKTIDFRSMAIKDIDSIYEIESRSFATPWSKEAFYNELIKNQFAVYTVVDVDQQTVGYGGMWIIVDEAHITNIALLPEYRGLGLGEALMRKMMEIAADKGVITMTLEVRVSNQPAQSLYRKLGFKDGAIRKQYYTDNMEDAIVMWVNLS
ncbi:ribosomal protein S18-alanine N-acetyltransferase [Mesobacillus zeae]|uniref:[Ribosomal protein bS18]-alanine N-acetyltransferase n=1 Tax=Mesobacillus zeae TaxID=1917180 RepID=A0A398B1W7_9BACI|nr:ribosomal protein S18-alanine N-acetyltransferase [Mesobacillus zeae]RID82888.1 ribosomal-protein-alanine N-acetyltransferase [Mesobacillus zeae]